MSAGRGVVKGYAGRRLWLMLVYFLAAWETAWRRCFSALGVRVCVGKREMLWREDFEEDPELDLNSRGEEGRDGHFVRECEEDVDEVEEDDEEDRL